MKMAALLRGINVGGNRPIAMPALCAAAEADGLRGVRSYIQSGNLVFEAGRFAPEKVTAILEDCIHESFGFPVDVLVRTSAQWAAYAKGNPFPGAAKERPALLQLALSKRPMNADVVAKVSERAVNGEKVKAIGGALWIDFALSVGKSKITPAVLDKAAGSPVTMRNWKTVLKLNEMLTTEAA